MHQVSVDAGPYVNYAGFHILVALLHSHRCIELTKQSCKLLLLHLLEVGHQLLEINSVYNNKEDIVVWPAKIVYVPEIKCFFYAIAHKNEWKKIKCGECSKSRSTFSRWKKYVSPSAQSQALAAGNRSSLQ